jgi:hypothetical protein
VLLARPFCVTRAVHPIAPHGDEQRQALLLLFTVTIERLDVGKVLGSLKLPWICRPAGSRR